MAHNGATSKKRKIAVSEPPVRQRRCSCGELADFLYTYDAEFCPRCDRWLDKSCGDRGCEFCGKRPKRPSLAPEMDPRQYMTSPVAKFNPPRFAINRSRS